MPPLRRRLNSIINPSTCSPRPTAAPAARPTPRDQALLFGGPGGFGFSSSTGTALGNSPVFVSDVAYGGAGASIINSGVVFSLGSGGAGGAPTAWPSAPTSAIKSSMSAVPPTADSAAPVLAPAAVTALGTMPPPTPPPRELTARRKASANARRNHHLLAGRRLRAAARNESCRVAGQDRRLCAVPGSGRRHQRRLLCQRVAGGGLFSLGAHGEQSRRQYV